MVILNNSVSGADADVSGAVACGMWDGLCLLFGTCLGAELPTQLWPCHQMHDYLLGLRCNNGCLGGADNVSTYRVGSGPVVVSTSHSGTARLRSTERRAHVQPYSNSAYATTHDTNAVPAGAGRAAARGLQLLSKAAAPEISWARCIEPGPGPLIHQDTASNKKKK